MKRDLSVRRTSSINSRTIILLIVFIGVNLFVALRTSVSAAEPLVDTGSGSTSTTGGSSLFGSGETNCSPQPSCAADFQFLAAQFVLTTGATFDSVEGWMAMLRGGSIEVKVRANSNDLPGNTIFSKTYNMASHPISSTPLWVSFTNYDAVLPAGAYWLTFEPVAGSQFRSTMPQGAPTPLQNYAFLSNGNSGWVNFKVFGSQPQLGLRIIGTRSTVAAFGTAVRAIRKGDFDDFFDATRGGVGKLKTEIFTGSPYGVESAWGELRENGLAVGSWSNSYMGTARGIAFRTFRNTTNEAKSFKVKAILNGRFSTAPFDLPFGPMSAAAAIRVLDSTVFSNVLNANNMSAAEVLLSSHDLTTASNPSARFADTLSLFPGGVLGFGQNIMLYGPFDVPITAQVETTFVTVNPQQSFVVMFDLATYTLYAGSFGCHRAPCQPVGHGSVYFKDSLSPAPNFFEGHDGNPITGIEALGPSPSPTPSAANIALTPANNSGGTSHTLTALVTNAQGAPIPDAVVRFEVTSGPHQGLDGGGQTASNGQTTFTYTNTRGPGADQIKALLGTLESNTVQQTWPAVPDATPTPTPVPLQLLFDESASVLNQVAALQSVIFVRDPFRVVDPANLFNFGLDRNTRIAVFVTDLQLVQDETVLVSLVDGSNQSFVIAAEDVRPIVNFPFMQVTFRLPDTISSGISTVTVRAHGQVSNPGSIRIKL